MTSTRSSERRTDVKGGAYKSICRRQSDASDRAGPPIRRRPAHARSSRSSIRPKASARESANAESGESLRVSSLVRTSRFATKTESIDSPRPRRDYADERSSFDASYVALAPLIATARTYEEFFIREFRGFIDRGSSGSVTRSVNPGRNARTIRVIRITLQPIYVLRGSLDEYRVSPATSMLLVCPLRRIPLARRRAYRSWRKRGERTTRYQEIRFRDRATASFLFPLPSFFLFFFIFSRPRSRFANTIPLNWRINSQVR